MPCYSGRRITTRKAHTRRAGEKVSFVRQHNMKARVAAQLRSMDRNLTVGGLQRAYRDAVKRGDDTFTYGGREMFTDYAKYLLEYLTEYRRFGPKDNITLILAEKKAGVYDEAFNEER